MNPQFIVNQVFNALKAAGSTGVLTMRTPGGDFANPSVVKTTYQVRYVVETNTLEAITLSQQEPALRKVWIPAKYTPKPNIHSILTMNGVDYEVTKVDVIQLQDNYMAFCLYCAGTDQ